jgi:ankyrin repeat protein
MRKVLLIIIIVLFPIGCENVSRQPAGPVQKQEADFRTLFEAIEWNRVDKVKELVSKGTPINRVDLYHYYPPLVVAIVFNRTEIVKTLLSNGADTEYKDFAFGGTPLIWAAKYANPDIVRMLIDRKANIFAKDNNSIAPVDYAYIVGRTWLVELLKSKGAIINSTGVRDYLGTYKNQQYRNQR